MIVSRSARGDPPPDLGRAGEGDLGDVGVLDQALPADGARPGDDVEHALRQTGLERDPLELERRQRGQLGRLEDDGVAGRERRRDLPGGDHQREVPRHDQADDPERLAEGHVDAAGDRDRLAEQALGRPGVVAEALDDHPDLAARVADRLAGVARLERGELLAPRASIASASRRRIVGAVGGRDRAPRREGRFRGGNRGIGFVNARPRDLGHYLLGRGLEHGERHAATFAAPPRQARRSPGCAGALPVPEKPEHELVPGVLDRLDQAVGLRPAGCDEPVAEPVDALVVVGVDA